MSNAIRSSILLVDYTNQLRREGRPLKDALLAAGPVRLRPIVMTTVAMILGMLPSAVGTGDGSEFRSSYTPTQASPLLRIPAGIFGPNEQTFRANLLRENVVRFDMSQPLYTGGRLAHAYGAEAATQEGSRLELERARHSTSH